MDVSAESLPVRKKSKRAAAPVAKLGSVKAGDVTSESWLK